MSRDQIDVISLALIVNFDIFNVFKGSQLGLQRSFVSEDVDFIVGSQLIYSFQLGINESERRLYQINILLQETQDVVLELEVGTLALLVSLKFHVVFL